MRHRALAVPVIALSLFLGSAFGVHALTLSSYMATSVHADAAVVMESATKKVIASSHPNTQMPIASLTKLMSALVILDTNPNWNTVVTYSASADRGGARLYIRQGERLTKRDLFAAMLIGSANNATMMLAQSTGLTTTQFVARMNAKAKVLGLTQTRFVEPTGLDEHNVSTASDYALLARAALSNETIRAMTVRKTYTFSTMGKRPIKHVMKNSDKLLLTSLPILGGKTGYLDTGYSLAIKTRTPQTGKTYITVLLNHPTSTGRFTEAKTLAMLAMGM